MSIIINNESAKKMVKRVSVILSGNVMLNAVNVHDAWSLTSVCQTPDQTMQVVQSIACEKGSMKKEGETFSCVTRAADFATIVGMISELDDGNITLTLKDGSLVVQNKVTSMKLDTITSVLTPIGADSASSRFSAIVGRLDLLHLIKDAGKFWSESENALTVNTIWHTTESSLGVNSCSGWTFGYDVVPALIRPGTKWEEACASYMAAHPEDEKGCDTAVPGAFLNSLVSVLSLTSMDKVSLSLDSKYMHLLFDEKSMLSVRLAAQCLDVARFHGMIAASTPVEVAVDKSQLETAVKAIKKRLDLAGKLSAGVGIHLMSSGAGSKAALIVKVGDNKVSVPIVAGADEEVDLDLYVNPELLESAISASRGGNIVLKTTSATAVVCNGTVGEQFAPGNTKVLVVGMRADSGAKAEAKFVAGVVEDEKPGKKSGKKKETEE